MQALNTKRYHTHGAHVGTKCSWPAIRAGQVLKQKHMLGRAVARLLLELPTYTPPYIILYNPGGRLDFCGDIGALPLGTTKYSEFVSKWLDMVLVDVGRGAKFKS